MNHHEQTGRSGEAAKAFGLETIKEILVLWHKGTKDYSDEFLAATLCTELERQCRVGVDEQHSEIRQARKLLLEDRLGECALNDVDAQGLLDAAQNYVKSYRTRSLADDDRAREGFKILSDYDALQLLLLAIGRAPLSSSARGKLRREQKIVAQVRRTLDRNIMALYAVAPIANDYCLTWNVEEGGVLSRVAHLGSRDLEVVWAERNRRPELLPEATTDCLNENQLTARFGGKLQGAVLQRIDAHVAVCRRCSGLLDEMTKSFIRTPLKLPKAPIEFLPRPLREIERVTGAPGLKGKVTDVIKAVIEFFVPRPSLQPVFQGAPAMVAEGGGLYELETRQVLFEEKAVQVVLFLRGNALCLSIFADKPGVVRGLSITVAGKRKVLKLRRQSVRPGAVLYALGSVGDLLGTTLVIRFHLGVLSIRREVRINEGEA